MSRIKWLIAIINIPRFLLHLLFFFIYRKRNEEDVVVGISHHGFKCSSWLGFVYLMTFDKTYRNLFYFRIGVFKYLLFFLAPPHNSFVIATHTTIGKGFLGIHPIGTFVNAERIGQNFVVKNNVTIGYHKNKRPLIGNNVTINSNAVVVGDITIGNNVIVGVGTVLLKSVPDNCVVVGNPAYILKEGGVRVQKKM